MIKIGYVCSANPFTDRKAWSGTIYKLRESIELAGFEAIWIPYNPLYKKDTWRSRLNNRFWKYRQWLFHKNILGGVHSAFAARRYAQSINLK